MTVCTSVAGSIVSDYHGSNWRSGKERPRNPLRQPLAEAFGQKTSLGDGVELTKLVGVLLAEVFVKPRYLSALYPLANVAK